MGITRKWVFPIIRIVILLVIAGALGKLAFFSAATAATDPTLPSAQVTEPMTTVDSGTITNDVTLAGTVAADPAVPIRATLAGSVKKVLATAGQAVEAKTPIVTIRSETFADDGTQLIKTVTVTAGSAGILSSIAVIGDQLVTVGDAIGQVAPPGFGVTGTLQADQQYRLLNRPTEAKVAITNGPAPFTCTGLTISTPLAGAASDVSAPAGGSSPAPASGGTTIHCTVPAGVTVFGGLAAKLTISGGVAENVLVVPITAVEGTAQTGVVYSAKPDGSTEARPVTLGLNDGKNVEVTAGLKKGDQILQYVPGAAAPDCGGGVEQQGVPVAACLGVGN
jgi:multidrug efflux pump subunit AcrA (membrane-fusion protein)